MNNNLYCGNCGNTEWEVYTGDREGSILIVCERCEDEYLHDERKEKPMEVMSWREFINLEKE